MRCRGFRLLDVSVRDSRSKWPRYNRCLPDLVCRLFLHFLRLFVSRITFGGNCFFRKACRRPFNCGWWLNERGLWLHSSRFCNFVSISWRVGCSFFFSCSHLL